MPLRSTADALIDAYFNSILLSFPTLIQGDFMCYFSELYKTMDLAYLIEAAWAGDRKDYMLYFAHARILAVNSGILNDDCYLGQAQMFEFYATYLLVTDQINKYVCQKRLCVNLFAGVGQSLESDRSRDTICAVHGITS